MSHNRALVTGKSMLPSALRIVEYLTREEVDRLAAACTGRNQTRDQLLIHTLFQTGVRISEALSITPRRIGRPERPLRLIYLRQGEEAPHGGLSEPPGGPPQELCL